MAKKQAAGRIRIKQVVSGNGKPTLHRRTLRALGIKRNQQPKVAISLR